MSVSVKKRIETFGAWCSGYVYLTDELQQERNASWVRYPPSLYIFESRTQVAA